MKYAALLIDTRLVACALIISVIVIFPRAVHANTALTRETIIDSENLQKAKNIPFALTYGKQKWVVSAKELRRWFSTTQRDDATFIKLRLSAIYDFLNVRVSPRINDLGEISRFEYVDGNLHLIKGGRKGTIVDGMKTSLAIRSALTLGKSSAVIYMKEYRPALFSARDFQKISFPNHLARGETNFAGSPSNRIHNIRVATEKFNGLVIFPGEEFSFNKYLGNVDAGNGYLPELVIKEHVTTPEYGGGICQVSTTAFRAAILSGLDITQRRNHSYPVRYYGTPGYDATVYAPYTDFRFRNDTTDPVLLKTQVIGVKVLFDVWGKGDGRTVIVNGPFITQKKDDGAIIAAVAQIVKKGGVSIREENFVSHYQSADKFPTVRDVNGG